MAFSPSHPRVTHKLPSGNTTDANPSLTADTDLSVLLEMLTYQRPAFSNRERSFIRRFIKPLGVTQDGFGNLWKRIDYPDGNPSQVMFSCHTDTVHRAEGMQDVCFDVNRGVIYTPNGDCLGADDGAGVWLMRELILAQVPGLYVFHRAEEIGGKGSAHIAKHTPELVAGIDYCLALDRMGFDSIITHQAGGRCCSDTFARSLMSILPTMDLMPDDTGLFTDSANYTDLIGECTNISVGYSDAHSSRESQNVRFLVDMRNALVAADWSQLVCSRQPGEADDCGFDYFSSRTVTWSDHAFSGFENDDDLCPIEGSRHDLLELVLENPQAVAALLSAYGVTRDEILEFAWRSH